jgi:hypothetical protein
MPDTKLLDRYTEQWSQIGFQGRDPGTDFRGMGTVCHSVLFKRNTDIAFKVFLV